MTFVVMAISLAILALAVASASASAEDDGRGGEPSGTLSYADASFRSVTSDGDAASWRAYAHWGGDLDGDVVRFSMEPLPEGWTYSVDGAVPTKGTTWLSDQGVLDVTINIDQDTEPGTYYMEPRLLHPRQDTTLASLPLYVSVTAYTMTLSGYGVPSGRVMPGEWFEVALGVSADAPVDRVVRVETLWAPAGWTLRTNPGVTFVKEGVAEPILASITVSPDARPGEYSVIMGTGTGDPRAIEDTWEFTIDVGTTRGLRLLDEPPTIPVGFGMSASTYIWVENTGNVATRVIDVTPAIGTTLPDGWTIRVHGPGTIPAFGQAEVMLSVGIPEDHMRSPAGTTMVPVRILTGQATEELPVTLAVKVPEVRAIEIGLPMLAGPRDATSPQTKPYEYSADLRVRDVGNGVTVHQVDLTSTFGHPIIAVDLSHNSIMMVSGMDVVVHMRVRVDPKAEPGVYSVRVDATDGMDEPAWISIGFEVSGANVSLLPDLVIEADNDNAVLADADGGVYRVTGFVSNPDNLTYDSVVVSFYSNSGTGSQFLGSVPLENVSAESVKSYTFSLDVEEPGETTLEVRLTVDGAAPVDPEAAYLVERFEAVPKKTPEPEGIPVVVIVMGIAVGALAGILAIIGTEAGKYALMAFIVVPLYTRLKPEQVTNHFIRGQILGYVKANPGETYTHIRKALGVSNGQFVYHSRILESQGFIKSVKDGANRRFYPSGMRIPREVKDVQLNQVQRIIYTIILEYPGISQSKIAKMVELAPSTVNYHVNIMTKVGVVERKRSGRLSLCFASQELD